MRGAGEGEEFGACTVAQTFVGHFGQQEGVAFAPEDAGGHADGLVWKFDANAEEGAIPVDHACEGTGLRPCGTVLGEIFRGESAFTAGAKKRALAEAEVESGKKGFRQPG